MKIVARYDFNGGQAAVQQHYTTEYAQIEAIIAGVNAAHYKTKISQEKNMPGKPLFAPTGINKAFKKAFAQAGWQPHKIACHYTQGHYLPGYIASQPTSGNPFREMDFIKPGCKLGIEVQFGKYAFMVYNVCAKMTIFRNAGVIDTGIEIVPVKHFADEMSTGVSYFEQFAWDLAHRGVANIDIPVLILGIDA